MKVAIAQLNYHIGNFESNTAKVIDTISKAKSEGADIVVFGELAICGYPPRDFLEFDDFINLCEASIDKICKECIGIAAIIGAPNKNKNAKGKSLYNSAYFLADGKIQSIHSKALLPTYDIFDEYRYFEPGSTFEIAEYKGEKIAITICEDLWNIDRNSLYTQCPMDHLQEQQPDFMVNISASPFDYNHIDERKRVFALNARKYNIPLFCVNHIGAQTELIFDGGSIAFNEKGEIVGEMKYFEEDLLVFDTNDLEIETLTKSVDKIELIYNALVLGVKDYFKKSGLQKAILGLSGGIDSAVTLAIASKALGSENVLAVLMPSKFSSDHSISDAQQFVNNLGCPSKNISIEDIAVTFEKALKPHFNDLPFDVAEENIQARARGVLLMGLANKFGYILFNTSNKSEAAVGYGTLYGDMAGGLSVIGDVYKTEVYDLANFINRKEEIIPQHIIDKPPSAELRPDQKDSDSLPAYDILDKVLYEYIELRKGPKEIIDQGFDEELVKLILKLVNTNEYKRTQTPPILRVSPKAFGMGRRMPIVGKYLS